MMNFVCVLGCLVGLFMSEIAEISAELGKDNTKTRGKRDTETSSYFFYQQPEYPRDCKEVYDQCEGQSADGVYLIKPEGSSETFEVYCNNSIDGGGWTVFQRRVDGSVDFYRYWNDYKNGFGFLRGDFWLGNDKISYLTNQKIYQLRIDVNNVNGEAFFAKYNLFRISDEGTLYRLVGLGYYDPSSTTNFDSMNWSRNRSFTTRDRNNDISGRYRSCATDYHSGWWYHNCAHAYLNNIYHAGSTNDQSIRWNNLPGGQYNVKYTEMKIRPLQES